MGEGGDLTDRPDGIGRPRPDWMWSRYPCRSPV